MGTTAEKLAYLKESKEQIKQALETPSNVMREYSKWIEKYVQNQPTNTVSDGVCKNALDVPLVRVGIDGNSYQETTEGKNILNINDENCTLVAATKVISGNAVTVTSTDAASTSRLEIPVNYKINTAYTVKFHYKYVSEFNTEYGTVVYIRNLSPQIISNNIRLNAKEGNGIFNFNIAEAGATLWLYLKSVPLAGIISVEFSDIQIVEGTYTMDNFPSYEPYTGGIPSPSPDYPQEIKNVGENGIKIKQSGKNKVDFINYAEKVFDSSKVEKLSDGSYKFKHCDTVYTLFEGLLKAPCTLSWHARNDGTSTSVRPTFMFKIFYEDGTIGTLSYETSPDFSLKTIVLTKNVIKIVNSYRSTSPLSIIKDVQLEKGTKATPYEPYHEPIITPINLQGNILSKVGDVKDVLKVNRNGEVEIKKNIGKVVLDGTENWVTLTAQKGDNTSYFYYAKTDMKKASSIICNQFINRAVWSTDVEGIQSIIDNLIRLRINTSRAGTVSELKAWLVAQKEAGTPVIAYYELATPQIITLPSISPIELWQGTNIFSLVTNLDTTFEVEYVVNKDYIMNTLETQNLLNIVEGENI